jgi:hypothetical protein
VNNNAIWLTGKAVQVVQQITYTTLPCKGSFMAVTVTDDTQWYKKKVVSPQLH